MSSIHKQTDPIEFMLMGQGVCLPPTDRPTLQNAIILHNARRDEQLGLFEKTIRKISKTIQDTAEKISEIATNTSSTASHFFVEATCAAKDSYSQITDYDEWKISSQTLFDRLEIYFHECYESIAGTTFYEEVEGASENALMLKSPEVNKTKVFCRDNGLPLLVTLASLFSAGKMIQLGQRGWKKGHYKMGALKMAAGVLIGTIGAGIALKSPKGHEYTLRAKEWWNSKI